MSETITPAMSPEEWSSGQWLRHDGVNPRLHRLPEHRTSKVEVEGAWVHDGEERHALAAMCLHEQPYGFTWEDVDALRDLGHHNQSSEDARRAHDAIDRIAALLPPRQP